MNVEYEFYMDLFFLINFYFNLLSLFLTAACLRRKCSGVRFGTAAAFGSFWNSILFIVPFVPIEAELPVTIIFAGGTMLVIAFRGLYSDGILSLLKAEGCLFLSAGLVNSMYSFSSQQFHLTDTEGLVFVGLSCALLESFIRRCVVSRGKIGDDRYQVSLYYKGKEKRFLALADSGNRLSVPASGKPVSLISYHDCKGFCEEISGGFYIPFRAVGTERGMLFAVQFDRMEVRKDGRSRIVESPAVAIVKERLEEGGSFSMIIPECFVPEE